MRTKWLFFKYNWYRFLYGKGSAKAHSVLGEIIGHGLIQGIRKGKDNGTNQR